MLELSHKKLDVYSIAMKLLQDIYRLTKSYPGEERFTLVSQLRRASVSILSNIAEGAARKSPKEKNAFMKCQEALWLKWIHNLKYL